MQSWHKEESLGSGADKVVEGGMFYAMWGRCLNVCRLIWVCEFVCKCVWGRGSSCSSVQEAGEQGLSVGLS